MNRLDRWWRQARPSWWSGPAPKPEPKVRIEPKPMKIRQSTVDHFRGKRPAAIERTNPFKMPTYPPGVLPDGKSTMAMDSAPNAQINAAFGFAGRDFWGQGPGFMGYPYLAELTQIPEYRLPSEVMAEEMTRKWIVIKATGDTDKTERVKQLTAAMKRFKLRETFRDATVLDGTMGIGFIHIDLGTSEDPAEMATRLIINKSKIAKGSLKGFTVVDPTWCAPTQYNTTNPLMPDFYKPQIWFAMGMQVHATRFLPIISRPLPDILKPAYNFGGLSLSQMLKPCVDNWLRTRRSVGDLLNAFTVFTLETTMQATLMDGGPEEMDKRLALFALIRDNLGLMAIDKETEALSNVSAPLGTLDKLQAQSQEHQSAVTRIPLVKQFGITPSGLNASSDGEIRVFYDSVHGRQERLYDDPLKICLDVIQLNEWGEIDPDLTFEFVSLWELDEAGKSAVQKTKADTDAVLAQEGAIGPDDIRKRVAGDPESPYHGLNGDAPGVPEGEEAEVNEADPSEQIDKQAEGGSETGANSGV